MAIYFRHLLHQFLWKARKRKSLGFSIITLALIISLLGNAITFYIFERSSNPDLTFSDCLWYSAISISTIGYGDLSAANPWARVGTVFFIVVIGLAAFTTFFGIVLDWFIDLHEKERKGMCRIYEKNHTLLINFPSAPRVAQVIDELTHEEIFRKKAIVIISDRITELPFSHPNVSFVFGSPVEEETYEKANIKEAREALVLCTSPDDPNSDSVVASIVSILEHIQPDLYTVAECLSPKHLRLFESTRCDSIVCSTRIINNLLVHESQDKGVIRLVDVITTHKVGDTIYTMGVGDPGSDPISYIHLAKILLDKSINLLCINRDRETFTDFSEVVLKEGDVLVYIAKQRITWDAIPKLMESSS